MDLGDKVSFEYYVARVRDGYYASHPERIRLPSPLTGIIAGKTRVYDTYPEEIDGAPGKYAVSPTLCNPQAVYVVAVSLHKKYNIFPGDIMTDNTQSTPPQTTPPVQSNPTGRPDLLDADLETRVVTEVSARVNASAEFSAWDITKALRAKDSATNLPHSSIRNIVHSYMDTLVLAGLYTSSLQPSGYYLYQPISVTQTTGLEDT